MNIFETKTWILIVTVLCHKKLRIFSTKFCKVGTRYTIYRWARIVKNCDNQFFVKWVRSINFKSFVCGLYIATRVQFMKINPEFFMTHTVSETASKIFFPYKNFSRKKNFLLAEGPFWAASSPLRLRRKKSAPSAPIFFRNHPPPIVALRATNHPP